MPRLLARIIPRLARLQSENHRVEFLFPLLRSLAS